MRNILFIPVFLTMLSACDVQRAFDGSNNNTLDPTLGTPGTQLARVVGTDYGDGISTLAGANRPNPRLISNIVHSQTGSIPNTLGASDFIWQWGQFLDHDIDLSPAHPTLEPAPILVPAGDVYFDPLNTGTQTIGLNRTIYDETTGTSPGNPRAQVNLITSFIDASNVYGSDAARASALRTNDGTGFMRTSAGNLLPFNTTGLENDGGPSPNLFVAGDIRSNEQNGLTAMHTLFVREHNRIAALINNAAPQLSGNTVYQMARHWVGGLIQWITYHEYLPALLGPYAPGLNSFYNPNINPQIANSFSTALFRLGHSQLSSTLLRLDSSGNVIQQGNLPLANAFFNPAEISAVGIEPILRGLATQRAQNLDIYIVDDVRNFLFGPPGAGGLDLASLNIQRGRDHGLPGYNAARVAFGLAAASSYADISSDPEVQQRLETAYGPGNVDDIDLWTGALAEDHLPGAHVGELIMTSLVQQFTALRDGDRQWYRNNLDEEVVDMIENLSLADVIRLNTSIGFELQDNVFQATQ